MSTLPKRSSTSAFPDTVASDASPHNTRSRHSLQAGPTNHAGVSTSIGEFSTSDTSSESSSLDARSDVKRPRPAAPRGTNTREKTVAQSAVPFRTETSKKPQYRKSSNKEKRSPYKKPASAQTNSHPLAVIDHTAFPHIIDEILKHRVCWTAMRAVSKEYYERVNSMLYRRILVTPVYTDGVYQDHADEIPCPCCGAWDGFHLLNDEEEQNEYSLRPLAVTAPDGCRLPGFKARYYDNEWFYSNEDNEDNEDRDDLDRCAALLERNCRVLETPLHLLHHITGVIDVISSQILSTYRISNQYCEDTFQRVPRELPSKVVLLPRRTLELSVSSPHLPIIFMGDQVRKVVSNVVHSRQSGPQFIPCDLEVPRSPGKPEVIYIFSHITALDRSEQEVTDAWDYLAAEIAQWEGISCALVNFPRDAIVQQSGFVTMVSSYCLKTSVDEEASSLRDRASRKIRFLSLSEYKSSLKKGEFEDEIIDFQYNPTLFNEVPHTIPGEGFQIMGTG